MKLRLKRCGRCRLLKIFDDFNKEPRNRKHGLASRCRACANSASAKWAKENKDRLRKKIDEWESKNRPKVLAAKMKWCNANKDRRRITSRLRVYGLSNEQYEAMLMEQDYKCAIGGHDFPSMESVCVDHDHVSGKIRGLLCRGHNTAIGNLGDNIAGVKAALAYLEKQEAPA